MNSKNNKQITLEIDIQNYKVKIIRAGGYMNKYENNNLFEFFPLIFNYFNLLVIHNQIKI